MSHQPLSQPSVPTVLTRATERAAEILGLSGRELAAALGASASSRLRISTGRRAIDPASREGEVALLLLRVFRGLDATLGGDAERCRRWLRAYNDHLGGAPAELLQTTQGLVRVAEYLNALRRQG